MSLYDLKIVDCYSLYVIRSNNKKLSTNKTLTIFQLLHLYSGTLIRGTTTGAFIFPKDKYDDIWECKVTTTNT